MQFANKKELVKKVQKALNIDADGIDGPNTWKSIAAKIIQEDKQNIFPLIKSSDYNNELDMTIIPSKCIPAPGQTNSSGLTPC